jgi:hypothetical protein
MKWAALGEELRSLRDRFERGEAIAARLEQLRAQVDEARPDRITSAPVSELARRSAAIKAELIRRHLLVGELELPEGSDAGLHAIAREFADRPLDKALESALNHKIDLYLRDARGAKQRVEELKARIEITTRRVEVLELLLALLELLSGAPSLNNPESKENAS